VAGGVLPTGTLSFGVGVSELAVTFNVNGDTVAEANNETFTLTLSNPSANTTPRYVHRQHRHQQR
jgi:hypothetical protein